MKRPTSGASRVLDPRFGALAAEEVARIPALLEGLGSRETAARALEATGPNAGPPLAPGDVEIRSGRRRSSTPGRRTG